MCRLKNKRKGFYLEFHPLKLCLGFWVPGPRLSCMISKELYLKKKSMMWYLPDLCWTKFFFFFLRLWCWLKTDAIFWDSPLFSFLFVHVCILNIYLIGSSLLVSGGGHSSLQRMKLGRNMSSFIPSNNVSISFFETRMYVSNKYECEFHSTLVLLMPLFGPLCFFFWVLRIKGGESQKLLAHLYSILILFSLQAYTDEVNQKIWIRVVNSLCVCVC